jgi:hypothetical protein
MPLKIQKSAVENSKKMPLKIQKSAVQTEKKVLSRKSKNPNVEQNSPPNCCPRGEGNERILPEKRRIQKK